MNTGYMLTMTPYTLDSRRRLVENTVAISGRRIRMKVLSWAGRFGVDCAEQGERRSPPSVTF